MSPARQFTEDDYDLLTEIANVAMGQAGSALGRYLDSFVELTVPKVQVVEAGHMIETLRALTAGAGEVSAVRQAFQNSIGGEVITLFNKDACLAVADLLGYEGRLDPAKEEELLLDLSNIIVGACVNGMAKLMNTTVHFSPPSLIGEGMRADEVFAVLLGAQTARWSQSLVIKIDFQLEQRHFRSDLLVFLPDGSIEFIHGSLDKIAQNL